MDPKLLASRLLTQLTITDTSHVVILNSLLVLHYLAQKKFIMGHWLTQLMTIPKHIISLSALVNNQEPVLYNCNTVWRSLYYCRILWCYFGGGQSADFGCLWRLFWRELQLQVLCCGCSCWTVEFCIAIELNLELNIQIEINIIDICLEMQDFCVMNLYVIMSIVQTVEFLHQ